MTGIYKITCPNGKIYIGQSVDIHARWNQHRMNYKDRKTKLQKSLLKHGHHNHLFEVVKLCNATELNEWERHFQVFYQVMGDNGLNMVLCTSKPSRDPVLKYQLQPHKEIIYLNKVLRRKGISVDEKLRVRNRLTTLQVEIKERKLKFKENLRQS